MSRKRIAGRLEGTHAFLLDDALKARIARWFLYQIDVAPQQRDKMFPQIFDLTEVIEAAGGEPRARADGQIHVGFRAPLAARNGAEQGDRFDAPRTQRGFVRAKGRKQSGP